jgi:hypothetical protein
VLSARKKSQPRIEGHRIDVRALESVVVQSNGASKSNPYVRVAVVTTDSRIVALSNAMKGSPCDASYETSVHAALAQARKWLLASAGHPSELESATVGRC